MSMNYSQYEELKTKLLELDARKKNLEKISTKVLESAKLKLDSVLPRVLHLTELILLTGNEVITEGNDESGMNDYTYEYRFDYPMLGETEAEKRHVSAALIDKFITSFGRYEEATLKKIEDYIPVATQYLDQEEKKLHK